MDEEYDNLSIKKEKRKRVTISKEEGVRIPIARTMKKPGEQISKFGLMAKLQSNKPFNQEALKNTLIHLFFLFYFYFYF